MSTIQPDPEDFEAIAQGNPPLGEDEIDGRGRLYRLAQAHKVIRTYGPEVSKKPAEG